MEMEALLSLFLSGVISRLVSSLFVSFFFFLYFYSVIVAIAMEAEAKPFVEHLGLKDVTADVFSSTVPFQAYQGTHGEAVVTVVTNGKDGVYQTGVDNCGTVPAALATYLALDKVTDADILINAGTAGGFGRMGGQIGDVYLTTAVAHHDR